MNPFGFSASDWQFFQVCGSVAIVAGLLAYLVLKWSRGGNRHDK